MEVHFNKAFTKKFFAKSKITQTIQLIKHM